MCTDAAANLLLGSMGQKAGQANQPLVTISLHRILVQSIFHSHSPARHCL